MICNHFRQVKKILRRKYWPVVEKSRNSSQGGAHYLMEQESGVTVHGVCRYEHEGEMLRKNRDWRLFCPLKRAPAPAFSLNPHFSPTSAPKWGRLPACPLLSCIFSARGSFENNTPRFSCSLVKTISVKNAG